jgi:beta-galactosidase/beta-glucuronidase
MDTLYLQNWKFSLDTHTDPWAPNFDDSDWQDVIVPHDWAVSFPFSREYSSGTGYLPGGTGWYRARFSVRTEGSVGGKYACINFDGVYKNSQVWCNGYYLGRRPYGYSSFRYDISHCIRPGETNIIAVRVSHEDIADSRWYTGSGIYRRVFIQFHGPLYIKPESLVVQTAIRENEGIIGISGEVINQDRKSITGLVLRAILKGTGGTKTAEAARGEGYSAETALPAVEAEGSAPFAVRVSIPHPRLWSAENPNLYRLTIELRSGEGKTVYEAPPLKAGIRSFRFDPDRGFFINGRKEKLKGVCVHHDSGCLGAAFWPDVWRRRLEKLKDMGCNAIRMSHNPQSPELYDLCDELGFYVMDEAFDEWEGCKNKWAAGHNVYPPAHQGYYEDFPQWHERDLADMIIRDRNHPSIIMWSIGNEIDYPNDPYVHPLFAEMTGNNDADKPKTEREYNPQKPNMERLAVIARRLVKIVKEYDQTRPVLSAAAFPELSSRIGFFDSLDMAGYNYKEQFYREDHRRFPRLPILGSENGHHLEAWKAAAENDFIAGQFLWTGIDFLGEAKGWPVRGSLAGLLDTAGFEKTGYYRRKALWSDKPVLYLVSIPRTETRRDGGFQHAEGLRSWNYRGGDPVTVGAYTNCEAVELRLNGKSLGTRRRSDGEEFPVWTLAFERGKLEAIGQAGGTEIKDALESTLPAVRFRLSPWEGLSATAGACRLVQVELELLDDADRLCVMEHPLVSFELEGEGRILGIENGDLSDLTEYSSPGRRVYRGRLIVYALLPPAAREVTLSAAAEGFAPACIRL